MMTEEMRLSHVEHGTPVRHALIVTLSAVLGSVIPLLPFLFLPILSAVIGSVLLSIATLFAGGGLKARLTVGSWKKEGLEMAAIGTASALAGYVIGTILQTF
jgi:predicted membrane protein (TIGR00267 family)